MFQWLQTIWKGVAGRTMEAYHRGAKIIVDLRQNQDDLTWDGIPSAVRS